MRLLVAAAAFFALLISASAQNAAPPPTVGDLLMPGPMGDKALGDPNAPIIVVEYNSLTCPHCQRFHSDTLPALKSKYIDTGMVYFIIRGFPLNSLDFAATMLARCADDRFFDVEDVLYDHQTEWAFVNDPLTAMLNLLQPFGIDRAAYNSCIMRDDVFQHIYGVAARGAETFGVGGTPTFFFNGHRIVGELTPDDIDQIIASLMKGPGRNPPAPAPAPGGAFTPSNGI